MPKTIFSNFQDLFALKLSIVGQIARELMNIMYLRIEI